MTPTHPTDYRADLQQAVDGHSDLIIAASFLLTDAAVDAARANPASRFVLLDPLVMPSAPDNLAVVTFREDEAGYLAGALAGLSTATGVVAGVYGLEDDHDRRYRVGFERGARAANPAVLALGVYQPPQDGTPYANAEWGAARAREFITQGADVIFGSGDLTGAGALSAAAEHTSACVTVGFSIDPSVPGCLIGTALLRVDLVVQALIVKTAAGSWRGGERRYGVADDAIELELSHTVAAMVRSRLETVTIGLAARPGLPLP